MEFAHPIGRVTSWSALKGNWKVVRSWDNSARLHLSYQTYKSSIPPQVHPAKCSPIWLVNGVTLACLMVTWLRGLRLWTIRSDFPSFLMMRNQHDWYEEFEGCVTNQGIGLQWTDTESLCYKGNECRTCPFGFPTGLGPDGLREIHAVTL